MGNKYKIILNVLYCLKDLVKQIELPRESRVKISTSKMHLRPPVALVADHSKVMALLLLIHCCSHCWCGTFLALVFLFSTLCPFILVLFLVQ